MCIRDRTEDDWSKFNERVKRILELYKLLGENSGGTISDDTSKRSNEVSEVNTSENQEEVSLSAKKVLINKVSNNDNSNNEFTGSKNDMILENDDENIMSENEVFVLSLIHIF